MMKLNFGEWLALIGLIAGVLSSLWVAIGTYHNSKRDLAHAKNSAKQLSAALVEQGKLIDQLEIEVSKLLTIVSMLMAQSGQTYSGILGHKPQGRR